MKLQYLDCPDNEAWSGESHCYWRRHLELLAKRSIRDTREITRMLKLLRREKTLLLPSVEVFCHLVSAVSPPLKPLLVSPLLI